MEYTLFEIKVPREGEETPEATAAVFSALAVSSPSLLKRLLGKVAPLFFEIAAYKQSIHFYASVLGEFASYFEAQISAQYPNATISKVEDYLSSWTSGGQTSQLTLSNYQYFPLKTWRDVGEEIDSLSGVLGVMAKLSPEQRLLVQLVVLPALSSWQRSGRAFLTAGAQTPEGTTRAHPKAALVEKKLAASQAFVVGIRLLAQGPTKQEAQALLGNLAGSFGAFSLGESNSLVPQKPGFLQRDKLEVAIKKRLPNPLPASQILTVDELASLWHLPSAQLSHIPTVSWGGKLTSEAPEELPVATTEEEKTEINFFARTDFKGKPTVFGIKREDRRRHMYLIGKTGTGKSTFIANMAINDMKNGEGVAVVDPHGDLSEILLDYIPSFRINDVVYLDASDRGYPFHLNLFESTSSAQRDLVASGVVAIFYKLYYYTWGPRLEYVFRNAILTLLERPNSTLVDVPRLLTDHRFREQIVGGLQDRVLVNFWTKEFEGMGERLQSETISPILNKVGQFVSSPLIRNIIGYPHSTINIGKIMNEGKILILNLSQGKLGEDNSALLGAMVVTKIQLAAMERVHFPESERRDFFLYVDEFQNFATSSFIKILSEARKYRLSLVLANQYIAQVPEEVQKAILGNVGSLVSFAVGAQDAQILGREFAGVYKEEDLVSLDNWQVVVKMTIDGRTTRPFTGKTLPLPRSRNQNRGKVIRVSRERYTKEIQSARPRRGIKVQSEENRSQVKGIIYEVKDSVD